MAEGVSVLSYPFFVGFQSWKGILKNVCPHFQLLDFRVGAHFSKLCPRVRAPVRPSVQKPIALKSVDFASPKMVGSKKRHIPFWTPFLPYNLSILCREKGLRQKNRYLLSVCFWFFVKFATANGGQQVTVGRGCLRGRFQNPWFLNRRGGCAQNITLFVSHFKKFYESITCSQKKTFPERSGI